MQGEEGTEKGVEDIGEEIEDCEGVLYVGHEGGDSGEEAEEGDEEGEDDVCRGWITRWWGMVRKGKIQVKRRWMGWRWGCEICMM